MPRKLSRNFTLEELTASQIAARRGLDNTPTPEVLENLRLLAGTLEDVRKLVGNRPILVSSGYRSAAVNAAAGGSKRSAHMRGLAVDFTVPAFGTVLQVARAISGSDLGYDQLIHEFGAWVHLGLSTDGVAPRAQDLSIFTGTGYLPGIVGKPA